MLDEDFPELIEFLKQDKSRGAFIGYVMRGEYSSGSTRRFELSSDDILALSLKFKRIAIWRSRNPKPGSSKKYVFNNFLSHDPF